MTFAGETCTDVASCLAIINADGNPDYDGIAGPLGSTEAGAPSQGSYAIEGSTDDNTIDEAGIDYQLVGDADDAATDKGPRAVWPRCV